MSVAVLFVPSDFAVFVDVYASPFLAGWFHACCVAYEVGTVGGHTCGVDRYLMGALRGGGEERDA